MARRRTALKITAWTATLALATAGTLTVQRHREQLANEHHATVAHATNTLADALATAAAARDQARTTRAAITNTINEARAAAQAAKGTLDVTPNAGDEPRQALQAAIDAVAAAASAEANGWVTDATTQAVAALPAAQQAATDAQAAWQAEQERIAAEKKAAEEKAAEEKAAREAAARKAAEAAAKKKSSTSSSPSTARSNPQPAQASGGGGGGGGMQAQAEAFLYTLPGSGGTRLVWDHPDMGNHLGAVWLRCGNGDIMINSRRLAGNPSKAKAVVAHEIAHVYQNRLICQHGYDGLRASLNAAFGGNGIERSADCVALRLGASWVNYTRDCSGDTKQAWVNGLIGGYHP